MRQQNLDPRAQISEVANSEIVWTRAPTPPYIADAMNAADTELWRRILANDGAAWSELINRYEALVYAVVTRSGLSLADAADCFQQTWVALFENRRKIKDPSRLSAWLVTTAKRETLKFLRRAKAAVELELADEIVDPSPLADAELLRLERQALLEIALSQLDPRCRKLMEEFFFAPEEKSYQQIAKSLGLAPNSLGPVRRRCLERLREILLKSGFPGVRDSGEETL